MLQWIVYIGNFNAGTIETYNIFDHTGFMLSLAKETKRVFDDREQFLECVKGNLAYRYWSKCEWEVVVSHWPPCDRFKDRKIDVYDQVMNNWEIFSEYIWENRAELKKWKREHDKEEREWCKAHPIQ